MQNEIWKQIEGYENYSVSDHGNIRDDKRGRIKKLSNDNGYLKTGLNKDDEQKMKKVHILVAQAFIPNPQDKETVDHIDNNKNNNNVLNLRWATRVEQQHNKGISKNNTSGTKGVRWNTTLRKWTAQIKINGKQIHLGSFMNKDDAITIRIQRAKDEVGEFTNKCELILNV